MTLVRRLEQIETRRAVYRPACAVHPQMLPTWPPVALPTHCDRCGLALGPAGVAAGGPIHG